MIPCHYIIDGSLCFNGSQYSIKKEHYLYKIMIGGCYSMEVTLRRYIGTLAQIAQGNRCTLTNVRVLDIL